MGSGPTFWGAIRGWSRVLSLAAVFCLFASVGLMSQLMQVQQVSPGTVVLRVLLSGGFAMGYAFLAMVRRFKLLPLLAAGQFLVEGLVVKTTPRTASLIGQPDALRRQLMILAFCAMAGIIAAYSLLVHFVKVEGQHYFQVQTEMALAAEIHTSLVPICSMTLGAFEIYRASVPSGEVDGLRG